MGVDSSRNRLSPQAADIGKSANGGSWPAGGGPGPSRCDRPATPGGVRVQSGPATPGRWNAARPRPARSSSGRPIPHAKAASAEHAVRAAVNQIVIGVLCLISPIPLSYCVAMMRLGRDHCIDRAALARLASRLSVSWRPGLPGVRHCTHHRQHQTQRSQTTAMDIHANLTPTAAISGSTCFLENRRTGSSFLDHHPQQMW